MTGTRATSIDCTQCGAGLNVLGGGRVRAHVCGYCGAELDAQQNYKVLRQFKDMERPASPFEIGMEGRIDGVPVVIIGTIGRTERYMGRTWRWTEHQLYSPTHGYAWLSWEDGHAVFSRKIRKVPWPARVTKRTIDNSDNRPSVTLDGVGYSYFSSGTSEITFIEGEFNWVPKLGDRAWSVSLLSDTEIFSRVGTQPQMLEILEREKETEYELSTLPDRKALLESFGIDPARLSRAYSIHALTPFGRSATGAFARNAAFVSALVCAALAVVFLDGSRTIARTTAPANQPVELAFTVTQPQHLVEVELSANVHNSWAWIEAEVLDEDDESVFEFERGVEYYTGRDSEGSWSEGSQTSTVRLRLPAGEHFVSAQLVEAQVDWTGGRVANQVAVTVREGVRATFWLWAGAVGFLLTGAAFLGQRFLHNKARMRQSDWTDD